MPNPRYPTKYLGPNVFTVTRVNRNRAPTGADVKQPETGKYYEIFTGWQVSKNPTTGTEGDLWILSKIVANVAYWVKVATGTTPSTGAILNTQVDNATAPGVNPVAPTAAGLMTISGDAVAAHTLPVDIHTRALNSFNVELQVASAVTGAPGNKNAVGLCQFDDTAFSVNADGYVTLAGGAGPAADSFNVDANTAPGTDPVVPTAAGVVTFAGAVVAGHSVPIETHSRAVNTINWEIQQATAVTATPADNTAVGVASFNNAQFTVDATSGMVSLVGGGGPSLVSFAVPAGTNPVIPNGTGQISITNGTAISVTGGLNTFSIAATAATTTALGVVELATTAETQNGTYGTTQVVTSGDIAAMMAVPSTIGSTTRNRGDFSRFAVGESSSGFSAITPARIVGLSNQTDTVDTPLRLAQTTTGAPAAGYGCSIELQAQNSVGAIETQVRIAGVWTDPTDTSEDAYCQFIMPVAGSQTDLAQIRPSSYRFTPTSPELRFGAGSPAGVVTAAQGSLYLRTDGSSTSTRAYINTDGGTGWTNITTAA